MIRGLLRMKARGFAVGGLILGAYAVAVARGVVPREVAATVSTMLMLLPFVVAGACFVAARRHEGRNRRGWNLLGAALVATTAYSIVWYVLQVVSHGSMPTAIDLVFLAVLPVGVAGILNLASPRDRSSTLRLTIDAIVIGVSVFLISWSLVLRPVYMGSHGPAISRVIGLVYPVGDVVILSLVAFVATRFRSEGTTPLTLIGVAMVIWSISDSTFAYLTFTGSYYYGHPIEVGWIAGFLLMFVAALRARPVEAEARREGLPRVRVPYLVVGIAFGVGVGSQVVRGTQDPVILYGLLGLSVLVLARQFVAVVEHQRVTIDRMEELDQLKTAFLMAISHELRTPLTCVVGYASLLDDGLSNYSTEEACEFVHAINVSGKRLERLLSDLLDTERLDRNALAINRRPTDLHELVTRVLEYSSMDERVQVDVARGTRVNVDPAIVERIVENLVVNAVKHTPSGTAICVRSEVQGTAFVLTVEDDGPGIPDGVKDAIFEPFRKGAPTHQPGTGVGLTLVAQFAKVHGGSAWVEDRPGGGSCFRVHFENAVVAGPAEGVFAA